MVFVSAVQFLQKTHNKTNHFVTFFSISLHFPLVFPLFLTFCSFFCHFLTFFKPPPSFSTQYQGCLKSPNTKKYTKTHLFGQIILPFCAFFSFCAAILFKQLIDKIHCQFYPK